jgi:hypothetical protein
MWIMWLIDSDNSKNCECPRSWEKDATKIGLLDSKKGLDMGFDYGIHYYGPYSSALDYAIHGLAMQGAIEIIPDKLTQKIHPTDLGDLLLNESYQPAFDGQQLNIIDEVIVTFAKFSARDLEVITTTDFVANNLLASGKGCTDEDIVIGVKTIKGEKFTDQIRWEIWQLKENEILNH